MTMPEIFKNKKVIFFDGDCNFCSGIVSFFWNKNHAKTLYYSSLQSGFAMKKLSEFGANSLDLESIYYLCDGVLFERSRAVFEIMKELGLPYRIVGRFLLFLPTGFCDAVYKFIAKNRYLIAGKRSSCRVANAEEKKYFLD